MNKLLTKICCKTSWFFPIVVATCFPAERLKANSDVTFESPVTLPPGGTDGAAASEGGDFDGDGRIEFVSIATNSTSDPHFRIYDFEGGVFNVITILPDSVVEDRRDRFGGDITPADINGDGWLDLVIPESNNGNGGGLVSWFENPDGDLEGNWIEHVIATWSGNGDQEEIAHMSEVDVGDINGDGRLDVITRDVSHGVYVMLREAEGSGWLPRRFIEVRPREGLDLFDPDGDGDLDIILNGVWLETPEDVLGGEYVVHPFAPSWYPDGTSNDDVQDYATQIALADFNGDDRTDIAISNSEELRDASSTAGKPNGVRIYLAPENPKDSQSEWTEVILEGEHFSWHSLEVADFNCDGAPDLMSAISSVGQDNAPPEVVYFLNDGGGTQFSKVDIISSEVPFVYNATVGDVDGDGDIDVFAPNSFNSGPMRLFENSSPINVDGDPPSVPQGLRAEVISSTTAILRWTASSDDSGISRYQIYKEGEALATSTQELFQVSTLSAGGVFEFQVSALDFAENESDLSSAITVATPVASDIDESLRAYWPLNASSGSAIDEIAGLEGVLRGPGIARVPDGRFTRAVRFADPADRIQVPSLGLSGSQLTLATWFRPSSFEGVAAEGRLISLASGTLEEEHDWMLSLDGDGTRLRFRLRTTVGGTATLTSESGLVAIDQWSHLAATYDGAAMRLWVDGQEVAAMEKSGSILANDLPFAIGNQPEGAGERAVNGVIDEVRIYDRALSAVDLANVSLLQEPDYEAWISGFLTSEELGDESLAGILGDANGDGVSNLTHYALGQNPVSDESSRGLRVSFDEDGSTFSYQRLTGGESLPGARYRFGNLVYEVEVSADLGLSGWLGGSDALQTVGQPASQTGGLDEVVVRPLGNLNNEENLFFRLRLTLE